MRFWTGVNLLIIALFDLHENELESLNFKFKKNQMRQHFSESWMNLGEILFILLAGVCKASLIHQNSDERSAWWNSNEIWNLI